MRQARAIGTRIVTHLVHRCALDRDASLLALTAALHLLALAAFALTPSAGPSPLLLVVTGLAFTLLALRHRLASVGAAGAVSVPSAIAPLLEQAEPPLRSPRESLFERPRLADRKIPASGADRRGRAWAELMAQVSHDLRTPLNAVIGFSDVMTAELFGPVGHPRYREYVDHIRDSGRALLKSAEDTLVLTQLLADPGPAGPPTALDLAHTVAEAWSYHAAAAGQRQITVALDLEAGLEVLAERRLLGQTVLNLFAAALSHAADGSTIGFAARADADLVEIELSVRRPPAPLRAVDQASEPSLSICLARALLELQDAFLVELPAGPEEWRAVTMLARPTQQDFFSRAGSPAEALAYQ